MKTAAVVTWVALVVVLGASAVVSHTRSTRSARADVRGVIERYGDGTIVVESATAGLREVRIDARTVVWEMKERLPGPDAGLAGAPATLADLRPRACGGRVWWRSASARSRSRAEIGVWDTGR
jgi:hypothetical protein